MMLENYYYLIALIVSIAGLAVIDRRFRLAVYYDAARTIKTIAIGVTFFVVWDVLGVWQGIFMVGNSQYLTGLRLGHEFPVEELFFLFLLVYTTLLLWRGGEKIWPAT